MAQCIPSRQMFPVTSLLATLYHFPCGFICTLPDLLLVSFGASANTMWVCNNQEQKLSRNAMLPIVILSMIKIHHDY